MVIWFLAYNKEIFCLILMKLHIRVQKTTSYKYSARNLGFGHVEVIRHNWAKSLPNMGVAAQRPPMGGWCPRPPQKFSHGS